MSCNEEVVAAVAGAVDQAPLDAGVNLTGLLIDMDRADSVDSRRYFMCWQLTRVLAPSLAEKVPPDVARKVVNGKRGAQPPVDPRDQFPPASRGIRTTIWWLSAILAPDNDRWLGNRLDFLSWTDPNSGTGQGAGRGPAQRHLTMAAW